MPNDVKNRIWFGGPWEKVQAVLRQIAVEDIDWEGTIDFNKIIPMPEELGIEDGSSTHIAMCAYLTMINPQTKDRGVEKYAEPRYNTIKTVLVNEYEWGGVSDNMTDEDFEMISMSRDRYICIGERVVDNVEKYGASTWFHWRMENWGTKWNAYDTEAGDDNELVFCTAWKAPHPVIEKLAKMNPELVIRHEWADEDTGHNCGSRIYKDGALKDEYTPDGGTEEAISLSRSVWGEDEDEAYWVDKLI